MNLVISQAETLGRQLRHARKCRGLTQKGAAVLGGMDVNTIRNLESGSGNIGSLMATLAATRHRFSYQPEERDLPRWLRERRTSARMTQDRLARDAGVSKPTIIQLERGRGNLNSLLQVMGVLDLPLLVSPAEIVAAETRSGPRIQLHQGDCLEVMRSLPDKSFDLVFTSPPYNLRNTTGGGFSERSKWRNAAIQNGYASHTDNMAHDDYVAWQHEVLIECWRLLTDDGAIYYNHKPRPQGGVLQVPLELNPGLPLRQIVLWDRGSGMNFSNSFYQPVSEWIMIFAKPKFRLLCRSDAKDVWRIPHDRSNGAKRNHHPAPFPVALPAIAIRTTGARNVLDPFAGSGTTGVAAKEAGVSFTGIELDPGYVAMAKARIRAA